MSDADPGRPIALNDALSFLPELALDGERSRRAAHGQAVAAASPTGPIVRLTDDGGLIALAEPAPGGRDLKPVVGFRLN